MGADIGGTFTDCVAVDDQGAIVQSKVLTTHGDFGLGLARGVGRLAEEMGLDTEALVSDTERFAHGSTIGTNLMVERRGARTVLLITRGHADVLLNMRGGHARVAGLSPERVYSLHASSLPEPLVPRSHVWELDERVDRTGTVVVALDLVKAREVIAEILDTTSVDSFAISFLWSLRNPAHEQAVAALIREMAPGAYVSLSSDIAPRPGEYERTVATVINAIVGPGTSGYVDSCRHMLTNAGLGGPFMMMRSDGGVVAAEAAKRSPLRMLDSGPAGGVIGARAIAAVEGHRNVVTADMGGTSFDVSLLLAGEPVLAEEHIVNQHTFFSSHIDVRSIACGGGSVARYDRHARSLTVGPESAGSDPGPAAYGRGGNLPTVTDADVVLGFLDPEKFLGGEMVLDEEAARRVVQGLAELLGVSVEEAAAGIIRINNNAAATLIRRRTLELGYDPRDFVIYAFGGSGPLHAFGFAGDLGIREVLVPMGNLAGTLSAGGIALADVVARSEAECQLRSPLRPSELVRIVHRGVETCRADLCRQGFDGQAAVIDQVVQMRYPTQYMNAFGIPVRDGWISDELCRDIENDFRLEYARRYGSSAGPHDPVEIFSVRVTARISAGNANTKSPYGSHAPRQLPRRSVFWPAEMTWIPTEIYAADTLGSAIKIEGPALIELAHTTVAVPPGQLLTMTETGSLLLTLA